MSEPPPSPLETTESSPRKWCSSKSPWRPSRGAHSAWRHWRGVRGKLCGGHGRPRSSTRTRAPDSASRCATTDPPKPEPITTASKRSAVVDLPADGVAQIGLVEAERARADRRLQLLAEVGVLVGDAADLAAQRAGDVHAGALAGRGDPAVAAAEADGRAQLRRHERELLTRRGVERGPGVAGVGAHREPVRCAGGPGGGRVRREIGGVELDARMREQAPEMAHALGVAD